MKIILIGLGVWGILVFGFISLFKAAAIGDKLMDKFNDDDK